MKKLLIILLFLGFSFSQEIESKIFGTWKVISGEQSYIFLKNGTGYWSYTYEEDGLDYNDKFSWMVVDSESSDGTLILEMDETKFKLIKNFRLIEKKYVDDNLLVLFQGFKWNGGDVILWWDTKEKTPTSYKLLEKY